MDYGSTGRGYWNIGRIRPLGISFIFSGLYDLVVDISSCTSIFCFLPPETRSQKYFLNYPIQKYF